MENTMESMMENTIEVTTENKIEKQSNIPSSAFDIEYRTQWRDEVDFLTSRGIYYTFRKKEGEYGIPTYKYTKTLELYLHRKPNVKSRATYQGPNTRPLRGKTEQRSAKKPVPAAEEKAEQLSFVQKDGSLDPKYVQKDPKTDKVEEVKPAEAKIEEVKTEEPKAAEKDLKIEEAKRILRESG